jgi:hypothetical protein
MVSTNFVDFGKQLVAEHLVSMTTPSRASRNRSVGCAGSSA